MRTKNPNWLLRWLDKVATVAIVVLCSVAAILVYLVAEAVYERPLHPLVAAADLAMPTATDALLPVTPRAVPMSIPPGNGHALPASDGNTFMPAATSGVHDGSGTSPTGLSAGVGLLTEGNVGKWYEADMPALTAGDGQIVVLLMGVDSRLGYSLVSRTDVLMLIAVDPERNTISLLSIPRDLYVQIPGHGRDRINTAFVHGSAGDNPGGGAALVMQTVEKTLGVAIDHYVLVDFSVLIKIVDTLGGIDVYVPYAIDDPTYPDMNLGYDPLYIAEGLHHFDGATALKYARTRHQDNDFYRAQRQQQIIFAVRRQVLGLGFFDLMSRAPALYERISSGVFTDLSLEEMMQMARVAHDIPEENIHTAVLNYNYVRDYWTDDGAHVLLLKHEETATLIRRMFGSSE